MRVLTDHLKACTCSLWGVRVCTPAFAHHQHSHLAAEGLGGAEVAAVVVAQVVVADDGDGLDTCTHLCTCAQEWSSKVSFGAAGCVLGQRGHMRPRQDWPAQIIVNVYCGLCWLPVALRTLMTLCWPWPRSGQQRLALTGALFLQLPFRRLWLCCCGSSAPVPCQPRHLWQYTVPTPFGGRTPEKA